MKRVRMTEVRARHLELQPGSKWFSPGAMKFFGTHLPQQAWQVGEYFVFITTEVDPDRVRRSSVRVMNESGVIDTYGDFHSMYPSDARRMAKSLVKSLEV